MLALFASYSTEASYTVWESLVSSTSCEDPPLLSLLSTYPHSSPSCPAFSSHPSRPLLLPSLPSLPPSLFTLPSSHPPFLPFPTSHPSPLLQPPPFSPFQPPIHPLSFNLPSLPPSLTHLLLIPRLVICPPSVAFSPTPSTTPVSRPTFSDCLRRLLAGWAGMPKTQNV